MTVDTDALRRHIGRYDANSGINFNRRWPDLLADRLIDANRYL